MLQEPNEDEITINTDSRLVDEFLLDPAAIVFLDDVAKEYGVEDPSFFGAMVATIIYRELQDPLGLGLPNADNPEYQSNWDAAKRLLNMIPYVFQRPMTFRKEEVVLVEQLDGDPSLGIGALSGEAGKNIQSDAERLGMTMYFPALGFDRPTTLDHVPFSPGAHFVIQSFFVGSLDPDIRVLRAIPPSDEKEGAWRVEIPRFEHGPPASLREQYEPTLGILAAEVAIAMRSTQYQDIKGEDKEEVEDRRIAFLIGNHANRSVVPRERLYNPEHFSEDTENEIQWARDFMELMDDTRTEIQRE